ncbi:MAG: aldo/keto reductase [Rikenellaceae bacterium]
MEEYIACPTRYDDACYRRCGKSGILLPAISLGLWHNFGSVDKYEDYSKIAFRAFDRGITHFDMSNNYGPEPGSAEVNFGKILKAGLGKYRDELLISTKAGFEKWPGPYGNWASRKHIMTSLDQSLKRMGVDFVDIYYSHRPDPNTPIEETMGAMVDLVRSGKVLYIGLSNYNHEQTARALEVLGEYRSSCLIHQDKYSMFERWTEPHLLPLLGEKGVGMIAFSPLAQGMLTNKYLGGVPSDSRAAKDTGNLQVSAITPEVLSKVKALNDIAAQRGQSLAQMAIAWLLRDSRVSSVLIGASSVKQLDDNLDATKCIEFSEQELSQIEAILS